MSAALLILSTVIVVVLLLGSEDQAATDLSEYNTPQGLRLIRSNFVQVQRDPVELPREVMRLLRDPVLEVSNAWLVLHSLTRHIWAVPKGPDLCLVDKSALGGLGVTCTSMKHALRRGITSTVLKDRSTISPAKREIVGFVPDHTDQVRIHTPGFPSVIRLVENNVFVLTDRVPQPPETIELISRSAQK